MLLFFIGLICFPTLLLNYTVKTEYEDKIYSNDQLSNIPEIRVGIVFGAGINNEGQYPSLILKDRLDTAVELYMLGKVQKLIVSGDNRFKDYNEPQVMKSYLLSAGIKEFDIQEDFAGRSTFETCYRAKEIFSISKAVLVTQSFHLPRALFSCESLGIEVTGASADKNIYPNLVYNIFREKFALLRTFYHVYIYPPQVVHGEQIII